MSDLPATLAAWLDDSYGIVRVAIDGPPATDPDGFARLARAWARGDVRTIEKEGLEDLRRQAPAAYARLVVARNRRWVGEIEALLKRPGRTFAVVGVGHLVGPDSVPALLRRDGVAVDGPK